MKTKAVNRISAIILGFALVSASGILAARAAPLAGTAAMARATVDSAGREGNVTEVRHRHRHHHHHQHHHHRRILLNIHL